jgi:hypothetical protein
MVLFLRATALLLLSAAATTAGGLPATKPPHTILTIVIDDLGHYDTGKVDAGECA